MSLSAVIRDEVAAIRKTAPLLALNHKKVLINNLIFCYHIINETEGLFKAAITNSEGELHAYYMNHLAEETGHAKWLREDLKSAGVDADSIPRHELAQEIVESQYHLINKNPAYFLGYMAVLEGFPTSLEAIEALEGLHGKEILRTSRVHAEEDIKHARELWEMIDRVNDPRILENAVRTAYDFKEMSRLLGDINVYATSAEF